MTESALNNAEETKLPPYLLEVYDEGKDKRYVEAKDDFIEDGKFVFVYEFQDSRNKRFGISSSISMITA